MTTQVSSTLFAERKRPSLKSLSRSEKKRRRKSSSYSVTDNNNNPDVKESKENSVKRGVHNEQLYLEGSDLELSKITKEAHERRRKTVPAQFKFKKGQQRSAGSRSEMKKLVSDSKVKKQRRRSKSSVTAKPSLSVASLLSTADLPLDNNKSSVTNKLQR